MITLGVCEVGEFESEIVCEMGGESRHRKSWERLELSSEWRDVCGGGARPTAVGWQPTFGRLALAN